MPPDLKDIVGFEWDAGNETKSAIKHDVAVEEAEQVFSNQPLLLLDDPAHSQKELRYHAFGKTNADRLLRVTFTIRRELVRVISVRAMNRREGKFYESHY